MNIFFKIPKRFRSPKVIGVLVIVLAVLFFGLRGGQDKNQIKTSTATRKTIESQISASGAIKSEDQASLKFLVSGKLAWLNVSEDNKVQKWQAVAGIENERYNAALRHE